MLILITGLDGIVAFVAFIHGAVLVTASTVPVPAFRHVSCVSYVPPGTEDRTWFVVPALVGSVNVISCANPVAPLTLV